MNIKKENDFVIKVKTPTTLISKHISLSEKTNRRSVSQASKSSKNNRSSQSLSYSDSFDSDSPVKSSAVHRVKRVSKPAFHITSTQNKKIKKAPYGISNFSKTAESTQKLLETSQLEINELISENADLRRQLLESSNELKTVQNQNKLQERYLNKVNSRDSDVPTIISRYNSELHSLQEQLRRKKEKLDAVERQKTDLDFELVKAKKKIEKLKALVADKQLQEREDLSKKIANLNDSLEVEMKKNSDLERSMELLSKKYNYQMALETNKFKELKQSYTETLMELKNIRSSLKEKNKLLEMQNIYSKRVVRAPHRLSGKKGRNVTLEDSNFPVSKISTVPPLKSSLKKEERHNSENEEAIQIKTNLKKKYQVSVKKIENHSYTAVQHEIENEKKFDENKKPTKVLFYGDTPSEISEIEEKSEAKFSDIFETVRRNMQTEIKVDTNNNSNKEDTQKSELLAKLKQIDDNKKKENLKSEMDNLDLVDVDLKTIMKNAKESDSDDLDMFTTSGSSATGDSDEDDDEEEFSDKKSDSSSPCLLVPRRNAELTTSKMPQNKNIKKETTQFEFLGFSVNTNNSNSEDQKVNCNTGNQERNNLSSDCEEIKID